MRERFRSSRRVILALLICATIAIGAGGVQGLVAMIQETTSLGTPFPENFDPSQVESSYTIATLTEFSNFATASRSYSFSGVTIHLIDDIDWDGADFAGIGSATAPFCGTFDGHGYAVRNLQGTAGGMFQVVGSADVPVTIRDLTVDGANISGGEGKAVLVCRFDGAAGNRIENVTVSNSVGSFSGGNCGILVGRCSSDNQAVTISGCAVTDCEMVCTASSDTNLARWGMILGKDVSGGNTLIENCTVSGSSLRAAECNVDQAGLVLGASFGALKIQGCQVLASSISMEYVGSAVTQELGGIAGCVKSSVGSVVDCTAASVSITTKGPSRYVGALVGHLFGGTVQGSAVRQSFLRAENESEYLGGMIGYLSNSKATLTDCAVGRLTVNAAAGTAHVGGIIGGIADSSAGTVLRRCSTANSYLSAGGDSTCLGGALGSAAGSVTAEAVDVVNVSLAAAGTIESAGGWAGQMNGELADCSVYISALNFEGLSSRVGGMVGKISGGPSRLRGCRVENTGMSMGGLMESVGGMVGCAEYFTVLGDSTVSGLTLTGTYSSNTESSRCIGGVIGNTTTDIQADTVSAENVSISLDTLVQGIGGFGGYISGSKPSVLTDCRVAQLSITENQSPLNDSYKCYHVSAFLGCVDSDSTLVGCSASDGQILLQGRMYYLGGLVGSTYSDAISATPVHGQITVRHCSVESVSLKTRQSRNCNESGGLVGWLSEGGTVENCMVSGVVTPSNTNSSHVGGLIGYIPESTTDSVVTAVRNCYVENCTLTGKQSLSATLGNVVCTSRSFSNNYYYNCTLTGAEDDNDLSAEAVTAGLTDGTLVAKLGQTHWVQGTASPMLNPDANGTTQVKVMTYNIYYLTQNDTYPIPNRQDKIIDLLESNVRDGVGVMGLQEVSAIWYDHIADYVNNGNTNLRWSGYGRYGGTFGGFGSGVNDSGDAFSLIVYDSSRYTRVDEGHFWLSDTPDQKSLYQTVAFNYRVVNWVRLRDKSTGAEFFFVNAHLEQTQSTPVTNGWGYTLDASSGVTARIWQAQLICDQMAAVSEGLPVILVGDWNSYSGTDGYSTILDNGYQDLRHIAVEAEQCGAYNAWSRTDPAKFAKGDHIVVSEGCSARMCLVLEQEDLDASTGYHISDHCPMIAQIQIS